MLESLQAKWPIIAFPERLNLGDPGVRELVQGLLDARRGDDRQEGGRAPRVQAGMAMLAAAMRAKAGEITKAEVLDLVETVARLLPLDLRYRAAVRAFANRILLVGDPVQPPHAFAGEELHAFLLEDGERMAAE
jgi:hypothetical protein